MTDIGMIVRQFTSLFCNRIADFGAAVADVYAVQSRKTVEQSVAIGVIDIHALTAGDNTIG